MTDAADRPNVADHQTPQPKLLAFVCHWCSLGGADTAGGLRLEVPTGLRMVRIPCSGRVDAELVLEAFQGGAEGVLILGCHPGDCHYQDGNYRARNRAALLGALLEQYGIAPQRLRIDWVGAAEGERFATITREMSAALAACGPLHRTRGDS